MKDYENNNIYGEYWTKDITDTNMVNVITAKGGIREGVIASRNLGARVLFSYKDLLYMPKNKDSKIIKRDKDNLILEFGYYPQDVAEEVMQEKLEKLYRSEKLEITSNIYTIDSRKYDDINTRFCLKVLQEYVYEDKKYVRVVANIESLKSAIKGKKVLLTNSKEYYDNDVVWIEVKPIRWIVNTIEKIMFTEKILFAGIRFNSLEENNKEFNKTEIGQFIEKYWSKEILQNEEIVNEIYEEYKIEEKKDNIDMERKKENPYGFDFKNVSEEEIIKGALESNIAVFLHGRSSEGKSARIKQFDPECEILYLRNATPESLNGKSVYNQETGEMIDIKPTWLQKLETKCEKEKNKLHIVFFDEITNALPSIQGMAFNIVLDREVNGKWKLPDNARIAAAGNDTEDSTSANELAEPLFNRFAHVYIETTAKSWLAWAANPNDGINKIDYKESDTQIKIHPSVYAYIAYKASKGDDVLRTAYNGKKPNADPRKWEMASKVLYSEKQPKMLRALIGEELTEDFSQFCKQQVISIDDVINNNYDEQEILQMNVSEKYATAVGLSSVDEKNVEKIRNFVLKMGEEMVSTFDNLWIQGNDKRLEKIAELRLIEDGTTQIA